jgi:hypothetical protein
MSWCVDIDFAKAAADSYDAGQSQPRQNTDGKNTLVTALEALEPKNHDHCAWRI